MFRAVFRVMLACRVSLLCHENMCMKHVIFVFKKLDTVRVRVYPKIFVSCRVRVVFVQIVISTSDAIAVGHKSPPSTKPSTLHGSQGSNVCCFIVSNKRSASANSHSRNGLSCKAIQHKSRTKLQQC